MRRRKRQSGAVLAEFAITLPVFLLLVFGMIELGIAVQKRNLASEAARMGARRAIVHGSDSPEPWSTTATAEAQIRAQLQSLMNASAVHPDDFNVAVTYQKNQLGEDNNSPGSPVLVRVSINHEQLVPFPSFGSITVASESSMIISN